MGTVNVRNKKLIVGFQFNNVRCRKQTQLLDTPANRKRMEQLLKIIEAEIILDTFNYAKYFPKRPCK